MTDYTQFAALTADDRHTDRGCRDPDPADVPRPTEAWDFGM